MKIQVDSTKCDAYGECVEAAPSLFELDDFGYATAIASDVPPDLRDAAAQAIKACPSQAIRVIEP